MDLDNSVVTSDKSTDALSEVVDLEFLVKKIL
jgi:hypothetical protein